MISAKPCAPQACRLGSMTEIHDSNDLDDIGLIPGLPVFEEVTDGVRVLVQSFFLEDQSEPENERYVWAYRITIENQSDRMVQLLNRHWIITDANGHRQEVRGPGVVGEQPMLEPGDSFTYTSGTPLGTATGFMSGSYEMRDEDEQRFTVAVPIFSLDSPHFTASLN